MKIDTDTVADIQMTMEWRSERARHREEMSAEGVNVWRDILPDTVRDLVTGKERGYRATVTGPAEKLFMDGGIETPLTIKPSQFDRITGTRPIEPRQGRFYPKGILRNVPNVYPQNMEPFRLVDIGKKYLEVDFSHPLAGNELNLSFAVGDIRRKEKERGGTSRVWIDELASGPGMQSRWKDRATDFFSDRPFRREDESPDRDFYEHPRLVHHVDKRASQVISDLYGRLIEENARVLDLMSSWVSHIPDTLNLRQLTGLGMNAEELLRNPRLTERMVHDLNEDPSLPFDSNSYDAVVCSVSVEYLIEPFAVFKELARILVPGGTLIITFSDRWFPPKVVRIWSELHAFERLGLVSEFFHRTGQFSAMETLTVRGLPRPTDDRYFPERIESDPVFAVWGRKRK